MSQFSVYYRTGLVFLRAAITILIFAMPLEKRSRYGFRVVLSMTAGVFLSYFTLVFKDVYLGWLPARLATLAGMLLVYLYVNLFTACCYRGSVWSILLISASGYAAQDISGHMKSLLLMLPGLEDLPIVWNILVDNAFLVMLCVVIYLTLERRRGNEPDYLDNCFKGILSVLILVICIGMGRLTSDNTSRNLTAQAAENIYAILVSSLLLIVQYSSQARARLTHDVVTMREMLHMQKVQYEANRENIRLVNEKYHDLQKILNAITGHVSQEQLAHLREEIAAYDSQMKTGSEVLDVILTEKRMVCSAKGILLTCLADGGALSFVDDLDLYALFGNLLTNAIEAVEELPAEQERFILITVRTNENMVTIHAENPCQGELQFSDGLPVTRGDPQWHGFGMKSMDRIAAKYGGTVSVRQNGGMFLLDILLLAPET